MASSSGSTTVTCDSRLYDEQPMCFHGVFLRYISISANGIWSVFHDLMAFFAVFRKSTHIVVLGVSGGPWFPLFRFMCSISGKRLLVNIDGVEWRRAKHSRIRRFFLRSFDAMAQWCANVVIFDNPALREFLLASCRTKAICIGYSGDHVIRLPHVPTQKFQALTICRIEPENNLDMLIEGALLSRLEQVYHCW